MKLGLISLAEEISQQTSIVWLLVLILMEIFNEREQDKQSKNTMCTVGREEGNQKVEQKKFCVCGDKLRKGTKARFHPIKFPICEMGLKKN